ncbi:hypothetical protein niasHS_002363 [Heterodera schachtii]|uniref:Clu domain-containing protein n=1 Tax=Heterodera schachtii TaxID=97005 RepID=A0ABD2KJQ3_HETSC
MATEIAEKTSEKVETNLKSEESTEEKGRSAEEADSVTHIDSGHESSTSVCTPDHPSTPVEEQKDEKFVEKQTSFIDSKFFHVRILVPGSESIEVQIGESDIIQELYHMLLERDSTCHRTCFKLYYEGTALDNYTELRNVPDIKDNAVMRVVEEPYNLREARVHVRHLREIIRSVDISDAVSGVDFASLSCLSTITQSTSDESGKKSKGSPTIELLRAESDCLPPEWLLPNSSDIILKSLIPMAEHSNGTLQSTQLIALKQISFSAFNPPPGPRKMKGDILYLVVDTVEDRRFHVTCCTRGFFVNSTIGEKFKPERSSTYGGRVFHSLFDLLSDISAHFKKTLVQLLKLRNEKHIFERLPTPFQLYQWIVPSVENTQDQLRADEQVQPHRLGLEDHMPGQIRDWNEELQTTHDMPQSSFAEKLCRDRARFKVHADFLSACTRGASAVIDGSVHTINPMDEPRMHMFIWNNIFFSLGFDVKDHYKELGGDAAAHASYSADLAAVQAYAQIDDPKLHTSGMAIIDFKGLRVMAQSIIPGILEREQQDSIVYGSYDSGKTVTTNEVYEELLKNSAKVLKIEPHFVWNGKEGEESKFVKLYSSYESKGIVGNDRRQYLMDLLRTFPPDVNFLEDAEPTELCKSLGFPRKFKHKLVYLRQELVDAFTDFKNQKEKEAKLKSKDIGEKEEATKDDERARDGQTTEEESETDIRLNPDAWSTAVRHAPQEDVQAQRKLIAEAAEFLLTHQIPQFVRDSVQLAVSPIDGVALVEAMHARGINIRYLGKLIEATQHNSRLDYLTTIAKMELLCRCLRHIFRDFVQGVEVHFMGTAIAHFLNCLIGSGKNVSQISQFDNDQTNGVALKKSTGARKKRRYGYFDKGNVIGAGSGPTPKTMAWAKLSQESLWKSIGDDSYAHFGLRIPSDCCDSFIEWSGGAQRSAIIRRFCLMNGVQIMLKNYQLNPLKSKSQAPFSEDDIFNVFPVIKRLNPRSQSAYNLYLSALIKMQQGFIRTGYDLMQQAHSMMNSIYGPLHPDLALCLRFMARMAYALNDFPDALTQQHRALLISERCNGIDHYETISDYINLAHFSFANLCIPSALKLLYRARHLLLLAHGEQHPYMGQIDANIGIILYALQEFDTSLKFLNNALPLYQKYGVPVKTALLHHVIARAHSCRGDFRTALNFEKETFNIYSRVFGKEHEKTLVSNECLRHLTKQAVNFQKHMNDASQGLKASKSLVPNFQVHSPSLPNIVELLNAFNNFLFWKLQIHTE